jgi:hypothetical protein
VGQFTRLVGKAGIPMIDLQNFLNKTGNFKYIKLYILNRKGRDSLDGAKSKSTSRSNSTVGQGIDGKVFKG